MVDKVVEFVRIKPTYPFSENKKDKFYDFAADGRGYRGAEGLPQPGYNPHHNLARPKKVLINRDELELLPY